MFTAALALLAASQVFQVATAAPAPTEPSSTSVFREGGDCTISWDADATGTWKVMNIELMTGSNLGMVHLRTVATVDGTDPEKNDVHVPMPWRHSQFPDLFLPVHVARVRGSPMDHSIHHRGCRGQHGPSRVSRDQRRWRHCSIRCWNARGSYLDRLAPPRGTDLGTTTTTGTGTGTGTQTTTRSGPPANNTNTVTRRTSTTSSATTTTTGSADSGAVATASIQGLSAGFFLAALTYGASYIL